MLLRDSPHDAMTSGRRSKIRAGALASRRLSTPVRMMYCRADVVFVFMLTSLIKCMPCTYGAFDQFDIGVFTCGDGACYITDKTDVRSSRETENELRNREAG